MGTTSGLAKAGLRPGLPACCHGDSTDKRQRAQGASSSRISVWPCAARSAHRRRCSIATGVCCCCSALEVLEAVHQTAPRSWGVGICRAWATFSFLFASGPSRQVSAEKARHQARPNASALAASVKGAPGSPYPHRAARPSGELAPQEDLPGQLRDTPPPPTNGGIGAAGS